MKNTKSTFLARCATFAICSIALLTGCSKKDKPARDYAPLAPANALLAGVAETKGTADNPMVQHIFDIELAAIDKLMAAMGEATDDETRNLMRQLQFAKASMEEDRKGDKFDWIAFAMDKPAFKADDLENDSVVEFPATSLVYAYSKATDFDAVKKLTRDSINAMKAYSDDGELEEVEEFFRENCETREATIAGCRVEILKIKSNDDTKALLQKVKGLEPCYGLFDGRLLIVASSPAVFENVVGMYSGSAPTSSNASITGDFARTGRIRSVYGIYGLASLIKGFVPREALDALPEEARPFVESAADAKCYGNIDGEAMKFDFGFEVSFTNPEQATILRSLVDGAKGMVNMGLAMVAMKAPAFSPLLNVINGATVTADGGKCVVNLCVTKEALDSIDIAALATQLKAISDEARAYDFDDEEDFDDGEDFEIEEDEEDGEDGEDGE